MPKEFKPGDTYYAASLLWDDSSFNGIRVFKVTVVEKSEGGVWVTDSRGRRRWAFKENLYDTPEGAKEEHIRVDLESAKYDMERAVGWLIKAQEHVNWIQDMIDTLHELATQPVVVDE